MFISLEKVILQLEHIYRCDRRTTVTSTVRGAGTGVAAPSEPTEHQTCTYPGHTAGTRTEGQR